MGELLKLCLLPALLGGGCFPEFSEHDLDGGGTETMFVRVETIGPCREGSDGNGGADASGGVAAKTAPAQRLPRVLMTGSSLGRY